MKTTQEKLRATIKAALTHLPAALDINGMLYPKTPFDAMYLGVDVSSIYNESSDIWFNNEDAERGGFYTGIGLGFLIGIQLPRVSRWLLGLMKAKSLDGELGSSQLYDEVFDNMLHDNISTDEVVALSKFWIDYTESGKEIALDFYRDWMDFIMRSKGEDNEEHRQISTAIKELEDM